jgi:hypothetical protein
MPEQLLCSILKASCLPCGVLPARLQHVLSGWLMWLHRNWVTATVLLRSLLVLLVLQVKKVEGYGSGSGRTSKKIVIADCGQLS